MLADEILVWRAWLLLHQAEFQRFDYNVRIGQGNDPGVAFAPNIRKMAIAITQLRIDAVAWNGLPPDAVTAFFDSPLALYKAAPDAQATIVEVKRRTGPANIGKLMTYIGVWRDSFPSAKVPFLLLVCADCGVNILPAVQQLGIKLEKVAVDFSELGKFAPRKTIGRETFPEPVEE